MKKFFNNLKKIFFAGVIFLLPLLILIVLLTKVFQFFTGFSSRLAAIFGLKSFMGISGGTVVGVVGFLFLCILCGYLMRVSFFKGLNVWVDKMLTRYIPGYTVYREMAMSKIEHKEEKLPYDCAAWRKTGDGVQEPCFLMETLPDGRYVVFCPTAGNVKSGHVYVMEQGQLQLCRQQDIKNFQLAIGNLGVGMGKQAVVGSRESGAVSREA